MRPVIYQLFVRHFTNSCASGKEWGTLATNGCGKFNDISYTALDELVSLGITHVWLTGVIQHATQTPHPGFPSQPAAIVKGLAGSPYAITNYFDLDPDLANSLPHRFEEFRNLVERCHNSGLQVIIDLVANHVSRAFSDPHPDREDPSLFFSPHNLFFHLDHLSQGSPPFALPVPGYEAERDSARVTGNNCDSWQPGEFDWYETVKLNFGFNFRDPLSSPPLPDPDAPPDSTPRAWQMFDEAVSFWQNLGVDGFRCDMAHMVPVPFWRWLLHRARQRKPDALFIAEAYDDHLKTTPDNPLPHLLDAGFDATYSAPPYHLVRNIFEGSNWANDLCQLADNSDPAFNHAVRYIENHDEVRLGAYGHWGNVGLLVGPAASAVLWLLGPGPILVYNGQETGECANGPGGFGGHNGRTSIFDYTCLPSLQKWFNHGSCDVSRLCPDQKLRRHLYSLLINASRHPALVSGQFYGLNWANRFNPCYGRCDGDSSSGHWIYSFLRHDPVSGKTALIIANLHPSVSQSALRVLIPDHALQWASLFASRITFTPLLVPTLNPDNPPTAQSLNISTNTISQTGLCLALPAGQTAIFELSCQPE